MLNSVRPSPAVGGRILVQKEMKSDLSEFRLHDLGF